MRYKVKIKKTGVRKLKQVAKDLQATMDEISAKKGEVYAQFGVVKDQFMAQFYGAPPKAGTPFADAVVPDSLREGLSTVEQGIDVKLTTGFSPQEVLDGRKSVVELVTLKGLKAEVEVSFLKSLHKTLQEAFKDKDNAFTQGLAMAGPAFGLSSRLKTELTFKDFAEIADHPMASQFVLTLSEILEKTIGTDLQGLREQRYDLADFEPDKVQALIDSGDVSKATVDELRTLNAVLALTDEVDPVTRADAAVYVGGLLSVDAEVRGHGFAELIGTIVRAASLRDRRWDHEHVHKAYLKAYDMPRYLELYGEEEKAQGEEMAYDYGEAMAAAPEGMAEGDYEDAPMMMEAMMEAPYDDRMEEKASLLMEAAEPLIKPDADVAPVVAKDNLPKRVKSTKPTAVAEDVYGDTEQMRQIKAYIQEQVQLRVNAAIDQEAERQIEQQMREFKEQYLKEAVQRIPQQNGSNQNQNGAQIGRIPANIVMGRQSLKKDAPAAGEKSERATRASRKDRAAA